MSSQPVSVSYIRVVYALMLSFRLRFGLAVGRYISVQNIS